MFFHTKFRMYSWPFPKHLAYKFSFFLYVTLLLYSHNAQGHSLPSSLTHYGDLTEFGQRFSHHYDKEKHGNDMSDIIYINSAASLYAVDIKKINDALNSGSIAILDGTSDPDEITKELSARIGGIGINSTVVMIRKRPDKTPEFKELQWFSPLTQQKKTGHEFHSHELEQLASESHQMLKPWRQSLRQRAGSRPGGRIPPWKPEMSIPVEIRQIGLPCMVGRRYEGNNITAYSAWSGDLMDACQNSASVSLFYTVDLIRSSRQGRATHNAKYVRITLDPATGGGAGWHLVDKPRHYHTWYESRANRETWFGPIADNYSITLAPLDPDVRLYHAIPANQPRHSEITCTTHIEIGASLAVDFSAHQPPSIDAHNDDEQFCCSHDHGGGGQPSATGIGSSAGPGGGGGGGCCCGGGGGGPSSGGGSGSATGSSGGGAYGTITPGGFPNEQYENEAAHPRNDYSHLEHYGHDQGSSCCHSPDTDTDNDSSVWYDPMTDVVYQTHAEAMAARDPTTHAYVDLKALWNLASLNDPDSPATHGELPTVKKHPEAYSQAFGGAERSRHRTGQYRDLEPSFSYKSKRSISYNNHEYEVINQARVYEADTASWLWSREFDKYASHWRTNDTCPLWCDDWFFADSAFSPAAYAHFTPGFSATFMVPAEKTGRSTIRFTSGITPVALGGRVQYQFLYQKYAPFSRKGVEHKLIQDLTINWDSTVFAAEIPISLEARLDLPQGVCLTVAGQKDNPEVFTSHCQFESNQIWGLDPEQRLRSFMAYDYCLHADDDHSVSYRRCDRSVAQKWKWADDTLINRQEGYLSITSEGRVITRQDLSEATLWQSHIRRSDISDALHIESTNL